MTRYTWRYVANAVVTSLACVDMWGDICTGARALGYGLFQLVARCVVVVLFPVSLPLIVYLSRRVERQYEATRKERQKAMEDDV